MTTKDKKMPVPKPGTPYVGPTGAIVRSKNEGELVKNGEIELGAPRIATLRPKQTRSYKDLPSPDLKTQTAIMVVLGYQIVGMTPNEISHLTGVSVDQIVALQHSTYYQETFEMLFYELISLNSSSLQARIASFAGNAIENVMELARSAEHEPTKLKANESILDRSGLHHETLFGKNSAGDESSLKIVYQDAAETGPTININISRK